MRDQAGKLGKRIVDLGTTKQHLDRAKAVRLANVSALLGLGIMLAWAAFELLFGQPRNLAWEVGLAAAFAAVLLLNGVGWTRTGRIGLILVADTTILIGAVMFSQRSGGALPFLSMVGVPLLLFSLSEKCLLAASALISVALFSLCETGTLDQWLNIHPRAAPTWYFGANAASTFVMAFLIPLFFYRTNRRAEADLERSGRERLKRIIDSSIIGVGRGRLGAPVQEANDALLNLLGFTREDLRAGRIDLERLTPPEYKEPSKNARATTRERGFCPAFEKEFVRKDGTRVPVLVGLVLLDRDSGDTVGFALDMTAHKHLERQREMLRQTEEAVRVRELFNSIASHELKTPLAALELQLELVDRSLAKGPAGREAALRHLQASQASTRKLGALVKTLLDVTKISHSKLDLSLSEVDLVQVTRAVVAGFETGRVCPSGQISVDAPPSATGTWDAVRLEQVITNLLSNAVKYGAGKSIRVRICQDADKVRFDVYDQGIGMDAATAARIFEPFQRAAAVRHVQGLGLGLFVVRSIVESHGGTIAVESEPRRGSHFSVELPRRARVPGRAGPPRDATSPPPN